MVRICWWSCWSCLNNGRSRVDFVSVDSVGGECFTINGLAKGPSGMIKVKSRGNETAEQMLRRFKKACEKEGLTKDIKRIAYYEKPSEKRRRRARSKPRLKPVR